MIARRTLITGLMVVSAGVTARHRAQAGPVLTDHLGDRVQTVRAGELPEFIRRAPAMQALYRYAIEHGDDLQYVPCFCGCNRFGHRSNRDCYIKSVNEGGAITFTSHALS